MSNIDRSWEKYSKSIKKLPKKHSIVPSKTVCEVKLVKQPDYLSEDKVIKTDHKKQKEPVKKRKEMTLGEKFYHNNKKFQESRLISRLYGCTDVRGPPCSGGAFEAGKK